MNVSYIVLNIHMQQNDAGAVTIREYLKKLLSTVWEEEEGFSGKRPFGNSGWQYDLYVPLVKTGLIQGSIDSEGYVEDVDAVAGRKIIADAIEALFE